jgi:hypothetical protein
MNLVGLAIIGTVIDGRAKSFSDTVPPLSGETTNPAENKEG